MVARPFLRGKASPCFLWRIGFFAEGFGQFSSEIGFLFIFFIYRGILNI